MSQLHGLTLSGLRVLKTVWVTHSRREVSYAKRPYAIRHCQLEFIPKDKPAAGVVLGINKVRETCWDGHPEDWVPERVVTDWLMQMIVLILLGMLFN